MTRLMYDTTDVPATSIPVDAQIVAGYIDGYYRSFNAVAARCPHAIHIPIAVFASTNGGQVLDCETGDATPAQCPGWIKMRRAAGLYRPTIYTLASWANEVKARCAAAGLVLNRDWDLWIAHYDGRPTPDGYGEVAKQYINHGPRGENCDISAVFDDAWPRASAPTPTPPGPTPAPTLPPLTVDQGDDMTPQVTKRPGGFGGHDCYDVLVDGVGDVVGTSADGRAVKVLRSEVRVRRLDTTQEEFQVYAATSAGTPQLIGGSAATGSRISCPTAGVVSIVDDQDSHLLLVEYDRVIA